MVAMQKDSPDISWFVESAYSVAFGVLLLFLLSCLWRRYKAKAALRRSEHSLES